LVALRKETTMADETTLIPIPKAEALSFFSDGGLDPILAKIKEITDAFEPDVTTVVGRKAVASMAYKVARSKTELDEWGKELVGDWKDKAKRVDAERRKARDFLDELKAEVRLPLDEWEEAEQGRIDRLQLRLKAIRHLGSATDIDGTPFSADQLRESLAMLERQETDLYEFADEADKAKAEGIAQLKAHIARQEKHEAEQAELERLRTEKAEREAREEADRLEREQRERDERIRREGEERAKREAAEREAALKAAAERAERNRLAAEEQAKRDAEQAERQRIAAEARAKAEQEAAVRAAEERLRREAKEKERQRLEAERRKKEEAERKAADERHRQKTIDEAVGSLVDLGFGKELAGQFVNAVVEGSVRHITIGF
jgi:hypothetical protein